MSDELFFQGFRRELIANFYIWDAKKKKKQNIAFKFSVRYRSFRFQTVFFVHGSTDIHTGRGMHDCGHKARVSPHTIKIQLSPMAYHREERFPRGGKWYTQLYSQVIPVESRGNYVVLQNENLNWDFTTVKIVYCSSSSSSSSYYYFFYYLISFYFTFIQRTLFFFPWRQTSLQKTAWEEMIYYWENREYFY